MKANKIIRKLVEENLEQVETTNKLLLQNEQRVERMVANHRHELESKNLHIKDLERRTEEIRRLRVVNEEYRKRLEAAGLNTVVNENDVALKRLREQLTGQG